MTEELYLNLLEKSELFCRMTSIDYRDFLHDIICEEPTIDEDNHKLLFSRKKHEIRRQLKIYYVEHIHEKMKFTSNITYYKWCPHCDLILPEGEFPIIEGNTRARYCKEGLRLTGRSKNSQKKRRDAISDGYIIDVLRKSGWDKESITPDLVEERRQQIVEKRLRKLQRA